jgi:hypothetical protein
MRHDHFLSAVFYMDYLIHFLESFCALYMVVSLCADGETEAQWRIQDVYSASQIPKPVVQAQFFF